MIAVCDTDPAKLYYDWALWKTRRLDDSAWKAERDATRAAFDAGELGLGDLIFFAERETETLQRHREGDPSSRRRRFLLHVELQPWFKQWWQAVDAVEPGRVFWDYPQSLDVLRKSSRRARRTGADLFDAVLAQLP